MNKCEITLLKRLFHKELIDEYSNLKLLETCTGYPRFRVGEEYIVEDHNKVPDDFSSWAWADIQKDVMTLMFDGNLPWMKKKGVAITCCTNGLMPVVFKVELHNEVSN